MSRKQVIEALNKRKLQKQTETSKLLAELKLAVDDFKQALGLGVEFQDLDKLLDQLQEVSYLTEQVKSLREAIDNWQFPTIPEAVKVEGLDTLLENIKQIEIKAPNITILPELPTAVIDLIAQLIEAVNASKYVPSQKPEDFIPFRRVVQVGNRLLFDDTNWSGGGGGGGSGAIPVVNTAGVISVPVTNPDGSLIGGGGGLTDIQLRATPVPVKGTLTNDNAAPSTDNIGALTAVVKTTAPTLTTGNIAALSVDTRGALRIGSDSHTDTGNSTTATLLAGAVFTGTALNMSPYASWSLTIFSNVASATDGIEIQWSADATNWDFADKQTYVAGVGNSITFGHKNHYVRLVYTNGSTNQTTFRVHAMAIRIATRQTRKFVGNDIVDQDTAQIVTAAIQGHTTAGGGAWVPVKVSPSGALTVSSTLDAETTKVIGRVNQGTSPWVTTAGIIDKLFDYISFTNADANGNYQTLDFKTGGAGGTTQRTLTLTYDANSKVTSITRS